MTKEKTTKKIAEQKDNPTSAQFIKNIEKDNIEFKDIDFERNIEKIINFKK